MEVSGCLHALVAVPAGKYHPTYSIGRSLDPKARYSFRMFEKPVVSVGIRTMDRPAHSLITK
jgi:hypothetical protein